MNEAAYWVGFSVFPGVGPKKFQSLLAAFGTANTAWHAEKKELEECIGIVLTAQFLHFRSTFSPEEYTEQLSQKQIAAVSLTNTMYPTLLRDVPNAPFVLYVRGHLSDSLIQGEKTIGVVGTRRITSYGAQVTRSFTHALVEAGYAVISGLALGVDAVAHKTTAEMKGYTVAVLGCGVDCCYPGTNQKLYDEILAQGGAIVSEYPMGMQPSKGSFPSRNRIVAGLSQAILVTEGTEDSGALITAEDAMKIGRKVFAIPGPITSSLSKGPYKLIQKGATLVTNPKDVLIAMGSVQREVKKQELRGDTSEEQEILNLLMNENVSFDEMVSRTKMETTKLGVLLSMMEMKGLIFLSKEGGYTIATY